MHVPGNDRASIAFSMNLGKKMKCAEMLQISNLPETPRDPC